VGKNFDTDVQDEMRRALGMYAPFHSAHEGYAVVMEEFDELWDEVRKKPGDRDWPAMYAECVQCTAMCIRFAYDVVLPKLGGSDETRAAQATDPELKAWNARLREEADQLRADLREALRDAEHYKHMYWTKSDQLAAFEHPSE
jgi:hypothetical protein